MSEQPAATGQTDPRQFDVVLVDQSYDARVAARTEADARLTAELGEGGRIRRFVSGIWKGNIAKDYYRHKYEQQALRRIEETQDVLIHESSSEARRDGAMYATIQRFQSEYEEMVHVDAGERRAEVTDDRITDGLKDIVKAYAEGRLDDTSLMEERARLLQAYRDERGDELLGEGTVQVDNLLDVARAVRGAVTHGNSLDDIVDGMRIITAESRSGVRTSVEYSRTDQVIDKLSKSKLGLLLGSEATIAAASIAASVARFGSTRAVGAAAMTIAPGVGAGLLAGLREKKRVKDDRAQHARELAQGKSFDEGDTRRTEMEATRYETVSAGAVTAELRDYLEDGLNGDDALQRALDSLAAIRAREHMSDTEGIDLIAYSAATAVEQERFDLALARAELKVALGDRLDIDARQRLSLDEQATVDELVRTTSDTFIETYQADIALKDQAFRKLRNRRVAKAAAQGVAVGLTLGIAAQEVGAALSSTREGLLEQAWGHSTQPHDGRIHETLLHGTFGNEPDASQSISTGELGTEATAKTAIGEHGSIRYADTLQVSEQNGRLVVGAADGSPLADVKLRPDGSLSDQAIAKLQAQGVTVEDLSRTVMVETTETRTVGVNEFMQHHRADTTRIARDLWYDNDTVAPTFEQNELGLHWGGENGSGQDGDGNVLLSVSTMNADGSFHAAESTDWAQDARTDTLKLAISPSEGTQARPFLVDVNPDGTIRLPADSPAAKFFSFQDGRPVFTGRYAEVVEMTGRDSQGVEHVRMLATLVGNDSATNLQDTFTTESPRLLPRYEFSMPVEAAPATDGFVEMAPVIPIVSRRSLESVRSNEAADGYYYGYDMTPQERRRFRQEECSPRLNRDPKSRLRPLQELSWRRQQIAARQGGAYLNQLDNYIDASPELSQLPAHTRAIVTVPVAAASEHDNIYKTLQSYASQDGDLSETTVLLHVNWFDQPKAGKGITQQEQDANVRQTFAEIERAKRDFPQLNIAVMQTQWERAREAGGEYGDGIIGHVARRMYDTAMMSVERQMRAGQLDGDADVLLVRNDSDAQGIQRTYLQNMIKAMQEHPENDVFTGAIRWGTERHRDLPGLGVVSNFREIMHILASRKGSGTWPPTVGINTGVRMSTFAAVGGVGDDPQRTGIGTDDYNIGGRIKDARQDAPTYQNRTYGSLQTGRSGSGGPTGRGYGTRGLVPTDDFSYHRHVIGATIDTAPERLERAYVNGVPIHDAWGDWDNTTRSEGLGGGHKDDLRTAAGRDALIATIEHDLSVAISDRFLNRRQVMAGLSFQFPDPRLFRLHQVSGGLKFELTPEGRTFLVNRLMRDSKGRFDPFGGRVRRALYNETRQQARKRPLPKQPLMV